MFYYMGIAVIAGLLAGISFSGGSSENPQTNTEEFPIFRRSTTIPENPFHNVDCSMHPQIMADGPGDVLLWYGN